MGYILDKKILASNLADEIRWPKKDLFNLREVLDKELKRRALDREAYNDYIYSAWQGFANFMYGVAQAMAARCVLRWSKGHEPYGIRPMHGECWSQLEIFDANLLFSNILRDIGHPAMNRDNPILGWDTLAYKNRFEYLWFTKEIADERWKWYEQFIF